MPTPPGRTTGPPPLRASRGEAYSQILADVMDHAKAADEARSRRGRVRTIVRTVNRGVLVSLGIGFVAVMAWNAWSLMRPVPELPPEERQMAVGVTIFAVAQQIEAFRVEHGRLPANLEEAGVEDTGLIYTVVGDRYRLDEEGGERPTTFINDQEPVKILEQLGVPIEGGGG